MLRNLKSKSCTHYSIIAAGALAGALTSAQAVTVWNEAVDGDLSNDRSAPTPVAMSPGINDVIGTTGKSALTGLIDRDYFTFNVPTGYDLVAIAVLGNTQPIGNLSFFGIEGGQQVTVNPTGGTAVGLLGWVHYNAANGDILNDLAVPKAGSSGFTPPLHAGDYSVWIQELGTGDAPYGFAFQIAQAAPEGGPGLIALAGAVGGLLTLSRRRNVSA